MVSIGNKFFYTVTLPCALWFFDRNKEKDEVRKDQVLMLDLRNIYRKVSSKIHDFTQEHLNNIHAIIGLYRGDNTLYKRLIEEYKSTGNTSEFEWLTSRFSNGKYADVKGLCKLVSQSEVAENYYSLTPARYVGVEDKIVEDFDYITEMSNIKKELKKLDAEANVLAEQIQTNLKELGL